MPALPEPFVIDVPQERLDDLARRLRDTRWALDLDNEHGYYGMSTNELKALVDYWIDGFDWRAIERRLNQFTHYRVTVDAVPVHFIHRPGTGPAPIPIILSHGWPWTFWDYSLVIEPLADPAAHGGDPEDAFDVVVPSLAGFGFSTPTSGDMNFWKMADVWNALMTDTLGYAKYAASGTDYGALVTGQLGHKYAANLYGIHLGHDLPLDMFNKELFFSFVNPIPPEVPDQLRAEILANYDAKASHVIVHMLDAQTITHGLNDSPAGMLAWLLQRWKKWSDKNGDFDAVFSRDFILTQATVFWVTQSIGPSIRMYRNTIRYPWTPVHDRQPVVEPPAGFTFLLGDAYPPGVRTPQERIAAFENGPTRGLFNVINVNAHHKGGHFVHYENPEAVVGDVRETFRRAR
jgi:pimeloyl-ACP methyl ester carboxylesterase